MAWTIAELIKIIIEISIIWFLMYRFLIFIQGTRVVPLLRGIIVLIVLLSLTHILNLDVVNWILTKLFAISVIGFLVIFQPEIRRGLSKIGQTYFFDLFSTLPEEGAVNNISQSLVSLAQKRIGALVAFERNVGLKTYVETGVWLDAAISSEMISTIFTPLGPLHDGGVIISAGRIVAAGCIFPLSNNPSIDRELGTRHRAAVGLSEETDTIVVVVSEETGKIAIAEGGKLITDFEGKDFNFVLKNILQQPEKKKAIFYSWKLRK
ncbi:MAG: diadenylate cyclase CdaA [Candidatus Omnitrophica bacterium]|nr:diadenylate cyclase CdaA [Candidatus Omnitrophota bacterium]MBU1925453.1 diadenylate cyclase CdaA [Candidatus Omnitrophota bacterium]MBU2063182.1 diadenylate cyclase CdaA [Candidatus Omnitrophota bacterium]